MRILLKQLSIIFFSISLIFDVLSAVAFQKTAENAAEPGMHHSYSSNGYTFEKVSHGAFGTETPDGVVDYLGGKVIAPYDGTTRVNNGDAAQSYSYCALAYGDWVYMGTMYGALSAYGQIKNAMSNVGDEVVAAVIDAMYNGMLCKGQEDDGYYAGSVFFKFHVKTGETKILMSRPLFEAGQCTGVPIFRNAVEYNDKLYFVGMVSNGTALESYNGYPLTTEAALNLEIRMQTGVPSIYEVDPETDQVKKIYECVDVNGYRALSGNMGSTSVFTSTRAIGTYKDALIAGGIQIDARYADGRPDGYAPGDACILASTDPGSGDFHVIATMEDLYDYPAIWRDGAAGGGGIYQVVEFNDSLYVSIVSGNYGTMNPETRQFRPFAVVRGDYDASKGAVDQKAAWTWTPVIGDRNDGAKYTYGIDPARTASCSCTLQPYGGYLYIGEYNDVSGSLTNILKYKDFATLAANLEQSINLYRMDKNEDIEMVVGDVTEMFPEGSLTGIGSGYDSHMNQYTWMTTVHNGVMYLSTMDETTMTRPISYIASDLWRDMSLDTWTSQIQYLKTLRNLLPKNLRASWPHLQGLATEKNKASLAKAMSFMEDAVPGFDLYAIAQAADGSVSITTISTDGFGDQYNHGLRIFASTDDYLAVGTANPFLGTQIWRMSEYPQKDQ